MAAGAGSKEITSSTSNMKQKANWKWGKAMNTEPTPNDALPAARLHLIPKQHLPFCICHNVATSAARLPYERCCPCSFCTLHTPHNSTVTAAFAPRTPLSVLGVCFRAIPSHNPWKLCSVTHRMAQAVCDHL